MAEDKTKFVRGNNLAPVDFDFDDANNIIKVKTDAVSSVGIAVAANNSTLLAPSAAFTAAVQAAETNTTFAVSGVHYNHTNEDGVVSVLQPGQFLSTDAGQSLTTRPDGRLYVNVIGMLPADSTYSGSTLGSVDISIEQDVTDPTMFTIRGDLDLAAQTPTSTTNLLKLGASGFYVSAADLPVATDTVQGKVALAVEANHPSTSNTEATTPAYVAAAVTAAATPDATDTVKGKVALAVEANHPSTSNTEAATPAYVAAAIAAIPAPSAPDGSETKVTAGTNVTVTGTGTTASPYVVNATGGSGSVGASQTETNAGTEDTKFVSPLKLKNGFAASITANGFIKFPSWLGGLVVQWGSMSTGGGVASMSFPVAYSQHFISVCNRVISGTTNDGIWGAVSSNTNNSTITCRVSTNANSALIWWISVGQ